MRPAVRASMYSPLDDFRSLIGDPSIMERAAPVDGDWRNVALPRYKRVFRFAVGTSGMAFTRCYWRTGGLSVRLRSRYRQEKDPKAHRPSPPAVSPPIPMPTTARQPESTARQREGAVPTLGNRRVCGLVWGLCFVAVATGMPLRATGDYFLDGCEYCCLFA